MKFTDRYAKGFSHLLPTPFTIAIFLTVVVFAIAFFYTNGESSVAKQLFNIANQWEKGLWNGPLMVFAMQMMLMLVLGHVLALSPPVNAFIEWLIKDVRSTSKAAYVVSLTTIIVSLFNWGLGLIYGAIICRKIGEQSLKHNWNINYPLIGASAYVGLMVWHGGLSGSSLVKVAEDGHLHSMMTGIVSENKMMLLPEKIELGETVFSAMNIYATLMLIIIVPIVVYLIGLKKEEGNSIPVHIKTKKIHIEEKHNLYGAERLDHSKLMSKFLGCFIIVYLLFSVILNERVSGLSFITPNFINLSLFSLGILFHKNFRGFLNAIDEAIGGTAGILIQFPLYFGIMGIMKSSGLVTAMSDFFIAISSSMTFPIYTLISAGVVNIFVPSGGGQWAIQGPILIQTALEMNVPLSKAILSLAYGDQLTNMLQPFWALPLLGITKLKAKDILPYTLLLMLIGLLIYASALLLF